MRNSRSSNYSRHSQIIAKHRREMRTHVYLPLAILIILTVGVPIVLALALTPNNLGTVTSFVSLLLLVPAALACLIPYVMIVGLTVGVKRLNLWLPDRFATTRTILHRANVAAHELSYRVASPFMWLSQRFAWLERFVGGKPPKAFPITPTERDL